MVTDNILPAEPVVTPKGRVALPIDKTQLDELTRCFRSLTTVQQDFLVTRFPHCETDKEAAGLLHDEGRDITADKVDVWKRRDVTFARAYELLSGRIIDWAKYIATDIEAGNALLGALEARKLIRKSWDDLSAREATAKMQAISQSLDRVVGKKERIEVNALRLIDLLPKE